MCCTINLQPIVGAVVTLGWKNEEMKNAKALTYIFFWQCHKRYKYAYLCNTKTSCFHHPSNQTLSFIKIYSIILWQNDDITLPWRCSHFPDPPLSSLQRPAYFTPCSACRHKKVIVKEMGDAGFLGLEKSIHFVSQVLDSRFFCLYNIIRLAVGKGRGD